MFSRQETTSDPMSAFGANSESWMYPYGGVRGSQLDSLIQLGRPWNVWMQSLQKGGVTWQLDGSETMTKCSCRARPRSNEIDMLL